MSCVFPCVCVFVCLCYAFLLDLYESENVSQCGNCSLMAGLTAGLLLILIEDELASSKTQIKLCLLTGCECTLVRVCTCACMCMFGVYVSGCVWVCMCMHVYVGVCVYLCVSVAHSDFETQACVCIWMMGEDHSGCEQLQPSQPKRPRSALVLCPQRLSPSDAVLEWQKRPPS